MEDQSSWDQNPVRCHVGNEGSEPESLAPAARRFTGPKPGRVRQVRQKFHASQLEMGSSQAFTPLFVFFFGGFGWFLLARCLAVVGCFFLGSHWRQSLESAEASI